MILERVLLGLFLAFATISEAVDASKEFHARFAHHFRTGLSMALDAHPLVAHRTLKATQDETKTIRFLSFHHGRSIMFLIPASLASRGHATSLEVNSNKALLVQDLKSQQGELSNLISELGCDGWQLASDRNNTVSSLQQKLAYIDHVEFVCGSNIQKRVIFTQIKESSKRNLVASQLNVSRLASLESIVDVFSSEDTEIEQVLQALQVPRALQPAILEIGKAYELFQEAFMKNQSGDEEESMHLFQAAREIVHQAFPLVDPWLTNSTTGQQQEFPRTMLQETYLNPIGLFNFALRYVANNWGDLHPFQTYRDGETGIYSLQAEESAEDETIIVGVVADWGSGTREAQQVMDAVASFSPHWTFDLGDHYYMGTKDEFEQNCLGQPAPNSARGVTFSRGSLGSFATTGNHDMYSRGFPFFDVFLPTLGPNNQGQKTTYAVVENKFWRVIMLDSGYTSWSGTGLGEPPLDKDTYTAQTEQVVFWLENVVNVGNASDTRGLLFLTHHGGLSAFWEQYPQTFRQVAKLVPKDKKVIWIWGHEHRLALYNLTSIQGLQTHGRCIGNSGEPVFLYDPNPSEENARGRQSLLAFDNRLNMNFDSSVPAPSAADEVVKALSQTLSFNATVEEGEWVQTAGFNGFSLLRFQRDTLQVEYFTLDHQGQAAPVIVETFTLDSRNGDAIQTSFQVLNSNITVPKKQ